MSLAHLVPPHDVPVRRFPPNDNGVLLPLAGRRVAALGVCMYTASSPRALLVQRAAHWAVRAGGARVLPGGRRTLDLPGDGALWAELTAQWEDRLGRLDQLAVYRRRQRHRVGLTLVVAGEGRPAVVVKVRDAATGLEREQQALTALQEHPPTTFSAPRPLGSGRAGSWWWSAQECVFSRPHRPVLTAPDALFEEVSAVLGPLVTPGEGQAAAHLDLTPWNLRRDHRGAVWLFDWEDWGAAPVGADRTYFAACSRAVRGTPLPGHLPAAAVDHFRPLVEERRRLATPGDGLDAAILAALDEAGRR
ncbi:hypothetical protein [Nocardioides dongxiaopingii]|uniref:hypothetical protein n=1 Tax=Nocardioides dongxiaopingii TaxID=2576036 RepID=UPI0010C77016|nr:hypothetical protein [Nocardioides dongxiaopingii]